jgi:acyl-CoA thioesterase YciA
MSSNTSVNTGLSAAVSNGVMASLPTDKELVLKVFAMPADSNANGDIFGGWVMSQVDLAGSAIPARISNGRIATVAVNSMVFKQPVKIGDLVSLYAQVEKIGTSSITVHVEAYAHRLLPTEQIIKVTEANLTYVAIDDNGRPRPVPKDAL